MLAQAAGLAVLAAISPTALLIATVYLGSGRPHKTMVCYLAGAVLMSTIVAVLLLLALRGGHFQDHRHRTPRFGLRTGLGFLLLAMAVFVATRKPRPRVSADRMGSSGSAPGKGILARLTASPAPLTAFASGLVIFTPSLTFIAAMQVVATAQAGPTLSALGVVVVVGVTVACVWLPLILYLAMPARTKRGLAALNRLVRAHSRAILTGAMAVASGYLVVNGLTGLTS